MFHSSWACCAVSRSTRGFGPGLRGAKGRPSRRSSIAIHSGLPSGRPMVGARSIRAVVASVGRARSAARATAPPLRARQPRPRAAPACSTMASPRHGSPTRDHRIESDITGRRQQMRLVDHHRAEATLEQMARPPEPSVDGPGNGSRRASCRIR